MKERSVGPSSQGVYSGHVSEERFERGPTHGVYYSGLPLQNFGRMETDPAWTDSVSYGRSDLSFWSEADEEYQ